MRAAYGMGARDMIIRLKFLGGAPRPLRRLSSCAVSPVDAEAPVTIDLDAKSFEDWYKETWKLHRRVPTKQRARATPIFAST